MQSKFPSALGDGVTPAHLTRHVMQNLTLNSDVTQEKQLKKVNKVSGSKGNRRSKEDEDERELEKQRLREERYARAMDDLKLLRDHYKQEYKKALTEKVNKQRKELKEREAKMELRQKLKLEEEKKRREAKPRLPKAELINDLEFRKGLQETEYQKIVKLENKLRKQGSLDKTHEMNEFWEFVFVPGNLEKVLKEGDLTWDIIKSYHRDTAGRVIMDGSNEDGSQSAVPTTFTGQWATNRHLRGPLFTPMTPMTEVSGQESPPGSSPQGSRHKASRGSNHRQANAHLTLEQRFPKVEFPPLAAYQLVFGPHEPDPEEVRRQEEKQQRLDARQEQRGTMNRMFSHALANKAATQRLMDRNKEFGFDSLTNVSSVKEIVVSQPIKEKRTESSQAALKKHGETSTNNSYSRKGLKSSSQRSSKKRPITRSSKFSVDTSQMLSDSEDSGQDDNHPASPPPLALEQLTRNCQIKEAMRPSTLWVNPA